MKTLLTSIMSALLAISALGVEPQPNGVRITWSRGPFETSYGVWQMNLPFQTWAFLGTTTATNWVITNAVSASHNWGITALRMSNGIVLPQIDVGVAHWPPSIIAGQKTVRLTPAGGYSVDTNRWIQVSGNLDTFDDWLKFSIDGNKVRVEHRASPLKPNLFMVYQTNSVPPPALPGLSVIHQINTLTATNQVPSPVPPDFDRFLNSFDRFLNSFDRFLNSLGGGKP